MNKNESGDLGIACRNVNVHFCRVQDSMELVRLPSGPQRLKVGLEKDAPKRVPPFGRQLYYVQCDQPTCTIAETSKTGATPGTDWALERETTQDLCGQRDTQHSP
jgi:hypothetical protein